MIITTHIGWDDTLRRINMENLFGLINSSEIMLKQNLTDFKERVDSEASKMSENEKQEYFEYLGDEYWQLSEVFPQVSRRALFAICYSTVEFGLNRLCRAVYADSLCVSPVPKRTNLNNSKKYLMDKVKLSQEALQDYWDRLDSYRFIRNRVIHHDATLKDDKHSETTREFISKEPSISIGQFDKIELGDDFCINFAQFVNTFIDQLVSELRKKPAIVQADP